MREKYRRPHTGKTPDCRRQRDAFIGALGAASILGVIDFAMWCRRQRN
jgi:hypothetical protein